MTTTEVATRVNGVVAAPIENFGFDENITAKDMIIPKILLMQKMSEAVDEGKAKEGDFVDSVDGTNLGKEFTAQLFNVGKSWRVFADTEKTEYVKTEPVTPENENAGYEYRDLCYNFSVLVGEDVGGRAPYGITFARTNNKTARNIITMLQRNKSVAGTLIRFSSKKEKNDKGSWVSWQFKAERPATKEEVAEAKEWWQALSSGAVKHHEETAKTEPTYTVAPEDGEVPF